MATSDFNFFKPRLEKGVRDIYDAQLNVAKYRFYNNTNEDMYYRGKMKAVRPKTGVLFRSLDNPQYSVEPSGEGIKIANKVPIYIRFLDMLEHGNFAIYNRQIYGILYGTVLKELKWDYREWVVNKIREQFTDTFSNSQ